MKKLYYPMEQRSGKTTMAIEKFLQDSVDTLFVSFNYQSAKRICRSINGNLTNFTGSDNFDKMIRGRNPKNIILDEYLLYNNKREIYEVINTCLRVKNLYIFSTPEYSEKAFNFVKANKKNNTLGEVYNIYSNTYAELTESAKHEIDDLYHNLITDHDTVIVNSGFDSIFPLLSNSLNMFFSKKYYN